MEKRPALVVFARAPRAGGTKTRLIPALGPAGAAELHRRFLLDTLANLRHLDADLIVSAAEAGDAESMRSLAGGVSPEAQLIVQSGADLGERIVHCFDQLLSRGHPSAVAVGSDSPSLPSELVGRALRFSAERDLVLGPSLDGGYYLIGLRAAIPALFAGIEWSSSTVLCDTLQRARELRLSVALLEPWYDVDTPDDLAFLRRHLRWQALSSRPIACPRTWRYLCDLPEREEP